MVNILGLVVTVIVTIIVGKNLLNLFTKREIEQVTREEGPEHHREKNGTPTMGGIMFILSVTLTLFVRFLFVEGTANISALLFLFVFLGFAAIGFLDDGIKVFKKRNLGINAKTKMIMQLIIFLTITFAMINNNFDTTIKFYLLDTTIDFGYFYYVLLFFIVVGMSNATNLTDGLDGLATTNAIISFLALAIVFFITGQTELLFISVTVIGGLLGFLFFNWRPAKIFMGDVGSLALGGGMAILAILGDVEMLLIYFATFNIIETLSVIIQVGYFKITKGKRIFKMSPIHHHFEYCGMKETEIVIKSNIFSIVMATIGIIIFII